MYITNAQHTKLNALEVASIIDHFVQNSFSDRYFELEVLDKGEESSKVWLRPILEQDFFLSADKSQIIRCIAEDGRRIDVLIPPAGQKAQHPATILIERDEDITA